MSAHPEREEGGRHAGRGLRAALLSAALRAGAAITPGALALKLFDQA